MQKKHHSNSTRRILLFSLPLLLAASALALRPLQEKTVPLPSVDSARTSITEMYTRWGEARVKYDHEAMETIVAPEFYVLLNDQEITREAFLDRVSESRPGSRLTRFDVDVLTVQLAEQGYTAVIAEKLEFEITDMEGDKQTLCSFWITRDGVRLEGEKWLVTSSEAIGFENWTPGAKPPVKNW